MTLETVKRESFHLACEWCSWNCTVSENPETWAETHLGTSGTYLHKVRITPCTVLEKVERP